MMIIFYYIVIKGMVHNDGLLHFNHIIQKSLRYHHHKANYRISLQEKIMPTCLKKENLDLRLW